jgi:hypothetical protein
MDHQDPSSPRDRGLRHVRRLSNRTAVALVVATGITAGYFAHATAGAARPATAAGAQAQAPGSHQQPCVTVPVATSGGSGVPTATVPSSCAVGQNGTSPAAGHVPSYEGRDDQ